MHAVLSHIRCAVSAVLCWLVSLHKKREHFELASPSSGRAVARVAVRQQVLRFLDTGFSAVNAVLSYEAARESNASSLILVRD